MYKLSSQPLITVKQINERLDTLAKEIKPFDFDIVLSVLTGSYIFTADLTRRISDPKLRITFIKASSYGNSTQSSKDLQITGLENLDFQDKKVLLIDDILDTGHTLYFLNKILAEKGAKDIKTCVLLNKEARREVDFHANFVGFNIDNQFVVGYGLDMANDYRTLPEIWTVREEYGK